MVHIVDGSDTLAHVVDGSDTSDHVVVGSLTLFHRNAELDVRPKLLAKVIESENGILPIDV